MTSYKKINIKSKRFSIIVISNSHPCWKKTGILFMLFSISKTRTPSCQSFFLQKVVYNKIVRSLDYLNQCKVLYVYVDITVLVWQKANGVSQNLPVKRNTSIGCERCSRFFKKTLVRRQSVVLVHLIISSVF